MARVYSMPPDTNEKEKIVGGLFTIGQAFGMTLGLILGLIVFFLAYGFFRWLAAIPAILIVVLAVYVSVKKVGHYSYIRYLILRKKFDNKIKYYINDGTHKRLQFSIPDDKKEVNE